MLGDNSGTKPTVFSELCMKHMRRVLLVRMPVGQEWISTSMYTLGQEHIYVDKRQDY